MNRYAKSNNLETRIYAIEPTEKLPYEKVQNLSRATFQKHAEEQGHVWTINDFLAELNTFQADAQQSVITSPRKLVFRTYNTLRYGC